MKKITKKILVVAFAFLMLAGCAKQSSWTLTINNDGAYSIVSAPQFTGKCSFGWQEGADGEKSLAEFSVSDNGEYPMIIADEDGKEYTITIICKDKKIDIKAEDGISYVLKEK